MSTREIVLDGPGMNALGSEMMAWIREQLREADGAPILFRGNGKAFSAGLDIAEVTALGADPMRAFLALLDEMVHELYTYPGPTVALVNGHAIAGGCVIGLCCDERIAPAGTRGKIGLNEVALGVRFPPRVMALVRDRVPRRHHERVLLAAELCSFERGAELGLLDEVAQDAEGRAKERLELLSSRPADAYAATKRRIREPPMALPPGERSRFEREDLPAWSSDPVRSLLRARLAE